MFMLLMYVIMRFTMATTAGGCMAMASSDPSTAIPRLGSDTLMLEPLRAAASMVARMSVSSCPITVIKCARWLWVSLNAIVVARRADTVVGGPHPRIFSSQAAGVGPASSKRASSILLDIM
jgi:hypothetical protein